jgi:hypothetical protein
VACTTPASLVAQPGNVTAVLDGCTVTGGAGTAFVPSSIPVTLTNTDLQFTVASGFKLHVDPQGTQSAYVFWKLHNDGPARCELNWTSVSAVDGTGTILGQSSHYQISHYAEFGPTLFADACLAQGHEAWFTTFMQVQNMQGEGAFDQISQVRVTLDRPSENTVAPDLVRVVNYSILANGNLSVELLNQGTTPATLFSGVTGMVLNEDNAPIGTVFVPVPNNLVLQPGDRLTRANEVTSYSLIGSSHRVLFRVTLN